MLVIKEIEKKRDIKKFVDFPNKLYKDNPYYIPPFFGDELNLLNKKKNAAYEYCETKLFLAYRDGKIVGRICALVNHAYNEKKNLKQMRFNRFDVIDDLEVTKELFSKVIAWAKERGLSQIIGPIGFNDLDKQGMLVEGFDEYGNTITIYNHPYYPKHLEALGFVKDVDWVEYQIYMPKDKGEKVNRLANVISKRYGYKVVQLKKRKEIGPYIKLAFNIINESFEHLYGVVPITEKQIDAVVKQFVTLINMEFLFLVTNKEDELIGFGILAPSLNEATKKSNGRLFPFGFLRALRALRKCDVLDMYLIAVKPTYQNLGVNALILAEGIKAAIRNNVKWAETGPELEDNSQVRSQWKDFEHRQHKRRRSYKLEIK
ncbi:MAG TPA: hypothetical protein GX692_04815 [Acholeplasmataceae bacterium]|nr:hypothetical protein [Acholeplasmataceae bacterium]